MIIVSIASVNHRLRLFMLMDLLNSLNRQTLIPDEIHVALEGYECIPRELMCYNKVIFHSHKIVTGGLHSFQWLKAEPGSICISLDDDLIIHDNFLCEVVARLSECRDTECISYLSKEYCDVTEDTKYADYIGTHFESHSDFYRHCHILGSGIAAFRSEHIKGCYAFMNNIPTPGIFRDMLVSTYLWLTGVSILRPPCHSMFIEGKDCSINCNDKKPITQRERVFSELRSMGFLDKTRFGSLKGF